MKSTFRSPLPAANHGVRSHFWFRLCSNYYASIFFLVFYANIFLPNRRGFKSNCNPDQNSGRQNSWSWLHLMDQYNFFGEIGIINRMTFQWFLANTVLKWFSRRIHFLPPMFPSAGSISSAYLIVFNWKAGFFHVRMREKDNTFPWLKAKYASNRALCMRTWPFFMEKGP